MINRSHELALTRQAALLQLGRGGLYLQDCGIAPAATPAVTGVKPYALDPEAAARLWEISERMVGERFTLS